MTDHTTDDVHELRQELQRLRAELADLRRSVPAEPRAAPVSRRALFGLAGAAAAGAVVASASPVAADDGDSLVLGQTNNATSATTVVQGNATGGGFNVQNGVSGGTAIQALAPSGTAVFAQSTSGNGLWGISDGAGYGVRAVSTFGRALLASGGLAAIKLEPLATAGPPTGGANEVGDLVVDADGVLYFCVVAGAPGAWRRLGGPATSAYTPVTPTRVYDSRWPGGDGALATGQSRTIAVADGKAVADGTVTTADLVPAGAIAVTYNVTVVDTVARGFLAVNPGGTTTVSAASINWLTGGLVLGNAGNVGVSATREVTVVCGGAGSATDFTIDLTGYHV